MGGSPVRRPPSERPSDGASTREAVLSAALAAFTEHTYSGASMAHVADLGGVAVGSIYRHFTSKEALGNAVYLRWKGRLLERVTAEVDTGAPVREAFGQLWHALISFARDHPDAFAFLEYQQHESYLDAESRAVSERVTAIATDMLVRGQRTGEVRRTDPAVLIMLAYGAMVGLSRFLWTGAAMSDDQLADAEAAVWDLIRAPGWAS
jgi:AcrR family transcriptional regulator